MTFNEKIKGEIHKSFSDNRHLFLSELLYLVEGSKNTHYRIGLENIKFGDLDSLKQIIKSTILDNENPIFTIDGFIYKAKGLKAVEYEDLNNYYQNQFPDIEELIINEFWSDPINQEKYSLISDFNVFSELVVEESEVINRCKNGVILEVENWQKYHQSLISIFLPDFKFNIHLSSRIYRYTKKINDNLFLCLEYDFKQEKQALTRGSIDIGKYKLVLLNSDFKRKTKIEEYYYNTNPTILKLCDAIHPIINNPCTELFRFFARENIVETSGNISFRYWTKAEYLPNDKIRLYNSELFGDMLKRHAFFYMDIYTYYFRNYLSFIESNLNILVNGQK